jgi:DNA-binding CsgD family transcriptional regulator
VALFAHDDVRAKSAYEEAVVLREEMGDRLGHMLVLRRLGYVAQHSHQIGRAAALFRKCLVAHRERGVGPWAALTLVGLAATLVGEHPRVAAALGGAAESVLESFGHPVIEPVEEPDYRRNLAVVRGLLREERCQTAWAEGRVMSFEQAVALALSVELPQDEQKPDGMIPRTVHRSGASAERPAGLTSREVEVLSLLASGESNREIGERLSISHRTVERHIAAIYRKIGARRRADAAAFAVTHGLNASGLLV